MRTRWLYVAAEVCVTDEGFVYDAGRELYVNLSLNRVAYYVESNWPGGVFIPIAFMVYEDGAAQAVKLLREGGHCREGVEAMYGANRSPALRRRVVEAAEVYFKIINEK